MNIPDKKSLIKVPVEFKLSKGNPGDTLVIGDKLVEAPGDFVYMQQMGVLRDGNDAFCVDIFFVMARMVGSKLHFGIHGRDRAVKPDNSHTYSFRGEAYFLPSK